MVLASTIQSYGQDASEDEDLERERLEFLQSSESTELAKPRDVEAMAKQILEKPLPEQTTDELRTLALRTIEAANFVDYIKDRYPRDKKYWSIRADYSAVSTPLRWYHNKAIFNLGRKAVERGDEVEAMFYFRKSYVLGSFQCGGTWTGGRENIRYNSEIEIKKLLGLDEIETYGNDRYTTFPDC